MTVAWKPSNGPSSPPSLPPASSPPSPRWSPTFSRHSPPSATTPPPPARDCATRPRRSAIVRRHAALPINHSRQARCAEVQTRPRHRLPYSCRRRKSSPGHPCSSDGRNGFHRRDPQESHPNSLVPKHWQSSGSPAGNEQESADGLCLASSYFGADAGGGGGHVMGVREVMHVRPGVEDADWIARRQRARKRRDAGPVREAFLQLGLTVPMRRLSSAMNTAISGGGASPKRLSVTRRMIVARSAAAAGSGSCVHALGDDFFPQVGRIFGSYGQRTAGQKPAADHGGRTTHRPTAPGENRTSSPGFASIHEATYPFDHVLALPLVANADADGRPSRIRRPHEPVGGSSTRLVVPLMPRCCALDLDCRALHIVRRYDRRIPATTA